MLIGRWRFDKRRSVTEWAPRKPVKPAQRDILFKGTQQITVRFTRGRRILSFRAIQDASPYRVVLSRPKDEFDAPQLVIAFSAPYHGEMAQHIEFVSSNCFRVSTGQNYEYFKRVSPNKSLERTREG